MMTMNEIDGEATLEEARCDDGAAASSDEESREQICDVVHEVLEVMLERYRRGKERAA